MSKLVRDLIPEIIEESGSKPVFHIANDEEFKAALKEKLVEEATEFKTADTYLEMLNELGDVMDVISEIISHFGIDFDDLEEARARKNGTNGAFEYGIILEGVEDE